MVLFNSSISSESSRDEKIRPNSVWCRFWFQKGPNGQLQARDGHKFESSMYITPTCCHYLFVCRSIRLDGPLSLFSAQTSALIAPLEVLLQDSHVCLLCWRYQPGIRWDRWDQNSSCLAGKGDSINRKRRCLRILYRVGARKTSCYLGAGALPWGMIAVGPTEKLSESVSESPKKWVSFKGPIPMHDGCPAHLKPLWCSNAFQLWNRQA